VHRAARNPQGIAGAPDNRLVAQLDGHLPFHHVEPLVDGVDVGYGRSGALAHPLLHDVERPAGLVAVDQHNPEEVEHPVGRGRLPVPSEADRGANAKVGWGCCMTFGSFGKSIVLLVRHKHADAPNAPRLLRRRAA